MIIGILGVKRSGKDTISDFLVEQYDLKKFTLSKRLKDGLKILFDFSDDQLYSDSKDVVDPRYGVSPRVIMQFFGTDIFRKSINDIIPGIKDNFWINIFINQYKNMEDKDIVLSDVRFKNEIEMIRSMGGIVIKVVRPSLKSTDPHESECINTLEFDHEIINDGTIEELYKKIKNLIENVVFKK
jgi:hypothetical protein